MKVKDLSYNIRPFEGLRCGPEFAIVRRSHSNQPRTPPGIVGNGEGPCWYGVRRNILRDDGHIFGYRWFEEVHILKMEEEGEASYAVQVKACEPSEDSAGVRGMKIVKGDINNLRQGNCREMHFSGCKAFKGGLRDLADHNPLPFPPVSNKPYTLCRCCLLCCREQQTNEIKARGINLQAEYISLLCKPYQLDASGYLSDNGMRI